MYAKMFKSTPVIFVFVYLSHPEPANKRVCVIGAGYSGLATARYLKEAGVKDFTVFEATRHVGGTWRFDEHIGKDEDGVPMFTNMYKYLRTNTPRQTMEFGGYSMPEGSPSYPAGTCFHKYLKAFVRDKDLMKFVKLRSWITLIKREGSSWTVTYTDTESKSSNTEYCGYVVIANGAYRKPKWPIISGQHSFKGNIIHSHDYRAPELFRNRKVLLVGAGPSGLDLAIHLVNVTEKLVHSHHLAYNQPNFPKSYVKKPDIERLTENTVVFNDGSTEEIDDVIFCTGFEFKHLFLDETSGVTVNEKFLLPLYQQIVNIRHPSMMFVGFAKAISTRLLDVQAEYVANLIAGKFSLPSSEQMLKSWLTHVYYLQANGKKITDVNLVGDSQDQYFSNLTEEAGVTRVAPVVTKIRDFNLKIRLDDLLNYRDYDFKLIDDENFERFYNPRQGDGCLIEDV